MLDQEHRRRAGGQNVPVLRKLVDRHVDQRLIHHLARDRIGLHDGRDGPGHAVERIELQLEESLGRRQRHGPQRDAREDRQRPFRAGQQTRQVDRVVVTDAGDVVAAAIALGRGQGLVDDGLGGRQQRPAVPGDGARPAVLRLLHVHGIAELDDTAVGQHRLDALHVRGDVAVLERMRPGRVVAHDAPDDRAVGARRVGPDLAAGFQQTLVQIVEHHARLARDRLAVDAQDPLHVAGHVEDDPAAQRLAGHPAARPARRDGQALLPGVSARRRRHPGRPAAPRHTAARSGSCSHPC